MVYTTPVPFLQGVLLTIFCSMSFYDEPCSSWRGNRIQKPGCIGTVHRESTCGYPSKLPTLSAPLGPLELPHLTAYISLKTQTSVAMNKMLTKRLFSLSIQPCGLTREPEILSTPSANFPHSNIHCETGGKGELATDESFFLFLVP